MKTSKKTILEILLLLVVVLLIVFKYTEKESERKEDGLFVDEKKQLD